MKQQQPQPNQPVCQGQPIPAYDQLAALFLPRIRSWVTRYTRLGLEGEDLVQEGLIGLLQAVRTFQVQMQVPFDAYAMVCIRSRVLSAVKRALNQKSLPLKDYVSLNDLKRETSAQLLSCSANNLDPQLLLADREEAQAIQNKIKTVLSTFEQRVLQYYLQGYSYREIAQLVHASNKSVDNALQRVRRKLSSHAGETKF